MTSFYITGANGFIGRSLASHLRARGDEVRGVDLRGDAPSGVVDGDVSEPGSWATAIVARDVVIGARVLGPRFPGWCDRGPPVAARRKPLCRHAHSRRAGRQSDCSALPLPHGTYSIEKAQRLLGYTPTIDLDEGMRRTAAWLSAEELI